jgi:hypothetical protein
MFYADIVTSIFLAAIGWFAGRPTVKRPFLWFAGVDLLLTAIAIALAHFFNPLAKIGISPLG